MQRILSIGVHGDDCEYGMGGTAKLLCDNGCEVYFLNILPKDFSQRNISQNESSAGILGATKVTNTEAGLELHNNISQSARLILEEINKIRPSVVFIQWPLDNHPDHVLSAHASIKALKRCERGMVHEIYGYETGPMQSMLYFQPDFYVNISDVKDCVKDSYMVFNQEHANGSYLWLEKEKSAVFRGHMSYGGFELAEAFKIIKLPDKNDDFSLRELLGDKFRWAGTGAYFWGDSWFLNRTGL